MKIKIQTIKKLMIDVLVERKVPKEDAKIIASEYLDGELQGKHSHGLMAFPALINKKSSLTKCKAVVRKKTASYILIDAKGGIGNLIGQKYTEEAMKMAKKQGIAVVFIKDMVSWLRPATIAQEIAENNLVGFVVNSGGEAAVAPPGGFEYRNGPNPIGIGIPTSGKNIIVDMATAKRAWGEVRKSLANNELLPSETYFDKKGNFTKDPQKADSVVASGDYKGFALGLFIEIMAGSFLSMPMSLQPSDGDIYRTSLRGAMILILNPQFSTSLNKFKDANKELTDKIRKSKKRKGYKVILVPGERALAYKDKSLKNGYLEISKDLWRKLNSLKK